MSLQRVDFYLLEQSVPDGKLRAACRIAKKAVAQGYTAYVHSRDPQQAGRLDDLMWTFDQGSFLAHRRDGDGDDPAPVVIGGDPPGQDPLDVLVMLGDELPEHYRVYQRIAEIVDHTDEEKRLARQHYKVYKEQGCRLETHHISP